MAKKNTLPISGGKAVVECLKANNVKHVFGLIGSATMELFDALYDEKSIKFIDVRDERTGTHMADAYARASGKLGVIIAGQNGPGATNLVTGVAQAKAAFSPLLSIAGAIATEHKGKDAFQEVDQQKLFEPITKKTFSIDQTKNIAVELNKAMQLAKKDKWGPVHVNIPRDILSGNETFESFTFENKTEESGKFFGRSEYMTSVIFNANDNDVGKIVKVKINKSNQNTLFGEIVRNIKLKVA